MRCREQADSISCNKSDFFLLTGNSDRFSGHVAEAIEHVDDSITGGLFADVTAADKGMFAGENAGKFVAE